MGRDEVKGPGSLLRETKKTGQIERERIYSCPWPRRGHTARVTRLTPEGTALAFRQALERIHAIPGGGCS